MEETGKAAEATTRRKRWRNEALTLEETEKAAEAMAEEAKESEPEDEPARVKGKDLLAHFLGPRFVPTQESEETCRRFWKGEPEETEETQGSESVTPSQSLTQPDSLAEEEARRLASPDCQPSLDFSPSGTGRWILK